MTEEETNEQVHRGALLLRTRFTNGFRRAAAAKMIKYADANGLNLIV